MKLLIYNKQKKILTQIIIKIMNFKNIKIGNKLLIGFSSIVIISIIIGIIGYTGMNTIKKRHTEVSQVRLPSIQALLIISEAQTAINAGENAMLAKNITPEIRRVQYQRFENAKNRAEAAWKIYEPLPQTEEEARVWNEFVPAWKNYLQYH